MITRADCLAMDAADPLASLRNEFLLPPDVIYLDGNSLGATPKRVIPRLRSAVSDEWATGLIRSWNEADWYTAPKRAGAKIARLVGADPAEVIVCDSTSVNLFKVLIAALRLRPERHVVLSESGDFPTDSYTGQSAAELMGATVQTVDSGSLLDAIAAAGDDLAVVHLTHIHYKTGQMFDMVAVTEAVHRVGGLMVWDLAHSAGAVPVDLTGASADFAVGCGYKYLNGGPGAPAFVFVAGRHLSGTRQPLTGWHGHAEPFAFSTEYEPHAGIERMLGGTSPQLSLIAMEEALGVFDGVDMEQVRTKSLAQSSMFLDLMAQELSDHSFDVRCPIEPGLRGSQVSFGHPNGYPIVQALIAAGVIGDFRAPDILRFGFAPLYVRFVDIWDTISALSEIMESESWKRPEFNVRNMVT